MKKNYLVAAFEETLARDFPAQARALKLAFEEMCRERVTLDHFAENEIASKLYLKTGFHYEGVMRHGGKKDGMYVDLHLMSMLREEYFAVNEK